MVHGVHQVNSHLQRIQQLKVHLSDTLAKTKLLRARMSSLRQKLTFHSQRILQQKKKTMYLKKTLYNVVFL